METIQEYKIEQEYHPIVNLRISDNGYSMECFDNLKKCEEMVCEAIQNYGHNPENNFHHFMYSQTKHIRNKFLVYNNQYGILAQKSYANVWYLFPNGILAPKEERLNVLKAFMDYALVKKNAKKLVVEIKDTLKKELFEYLKKQDEYRPLTMAYVLYWPLYNMKRWDPTLAGKSWKKIRNLVNAFESYEMNLEIVDSRRISAKKLRKLIDEWIEYRGADDLVDKRYFYNLVDNDFKGFDICRSIMIDGKPTTITCGWRIPNSNNYYSAIGILNYEVDHLGIYANIDDLRHLKKRGFDWVDFGGGPPEIIQFKKKFKPEKIYKTYSFSIVRR